MKKNVIYKILIFLFSFALIYHILILVKIVPYKLAWGGRLKSDQEMYVFESFSLVLNFLFLLFVAIQLKFITILLHPLFCKTIWWFLAIVFAINTIGNTMAIYPFEKYFFTPITFISSICAFIIIFSKKE